MKSADASDYLLERAEEHDSETTPLEAHSTESGSIGTDVVLAVAAVTGTDPMKLPRFAEAVDPDALEELLGSCDGSVSVSFTYANCEITVDEGRNVTVTPRR